jgi:hypothetical protein
MISRRVVAGIVIATGAGVALLGLAACGERSQVIEYKQGTYQGKPDTPAWTDKPWNGNRQEWSVAVDTRAQNQNEYKRIR